MLDEKIKYLIDHLPPGIRIKSDFDLGKRNGLRIPGNVGALAEPQNKDDLKRLIFQCHHNGIPYHVLGLSYNSISFDMPDTIAISMRSLTNILDENGVRHKLDGGVKPNGGRFTIEAGARLGRRNNYWSANMQSKIEDTSYLEKMMKDSIIGYCYSNGIGKATNPETGKGSNIHDLCDIPGTIGGAVWGNAAAFNADIGTFVESVRIINPKNASERTYKNDQLGFDYRSNKKLQENPDYVIYSVTLNMDMIEPEEIKMIPEKWKHVIKERINKYPQEPSLGSVFKLRGYSEGGIGPQTAIELIDISRRNMRESDITFQTEFGGIRIPESYPIYMTNPDNNATVSDLTDAMKYLYGIVKKYTGESLKPEINFLPRGKTPDFDKGLAEFLQRYGIEYKPNGKDRINSNIVYQA